MPSLLDRVSRASVPLAALPSLAPLRAHRDLHIVVAGDRLWLDWPQGDEEVPRFVLPIQGAEFFFEHEGEWFRPGQRVPVLGTMPADTGQPLHALLVPASHAVAPNTSIHLDSLRLRCVRDGQPRTVSAMMLPLDLFRSWVDRATKWDLDQVQAALNGDRVLLRGDHLPGLISGVRYWGKTILVPLGYRPEPDWPESALRVVLSLQAEELALLDESTSEIVDLAAFGPVARAGVRGLAEGLRR